jgi:hypothetical protein
MLPVRISDATVDLKTLRFNKHVAIAAAAPVGILPVLDETGSD